MQLRHGVNLAQNGADGALAGEERLLHDVIALGQRGLLGKNAGQVGGARGEMKAPLAQFGDGLQKWHILANANGDHRKLNALRPHLGDQLARALLPLAVRAIGQQNDELVLFVARAQNFSRFAQRLKNINSAPAWPHPQNFWDGGGFVAAQKRADDIHRLGVKPNHGQLVLVVHQLGHAGGGLGGQPNFDHAVLGHAHAAAFVHHHHHRHRWKPARVFDLHLHGQRFF